MRCVQHITTGGEVNEFSRSIKTWRGLTIGELLVPSEERVRKKIPRKKIKIKGGVCIERLSDNVFRRILGDWIVCWHMAREGERSTARLGNNLKKQSRLIEQAIHHGGVWTRLKQDTFWRRADAGRWTAVMRRARMRGWKRCSIVTVSAAALYITYFILNTVDLCYSSREYNILHDYVNKLKLH